MVFHKVLCFISDIFHSRPSGTSRNTFYILVYSAVTRCWDIVVPWQVRMKHFINYPYITVLFVYQRSNVTVEDGRKLVSVESQPNCPFNDYKSPPPPPPPQPSSQGTLISSGAYCPPVDKPEQALDLLQEAATRAGYQLNTDVGVIVDVGAEKLYDQVRWFALDTLLTQVQRFGGTKINNVNNSYTKGKASAA